MKRYHVQLLCGWQCIVDMYPDDPEYIIETTDGKRAYIQKVVAEFPGIVARGAAMHEIKERVRRMNAPYLTCNTIAEMLAIHEQTTPTENLQPQHIPMNIREALDSGLTMIDDIGECRMRKMNGEIQIQKDPGDQWLPLDSFDAADRTYFTKVCQWQPENTY